MDIGFHTGITYVTHTHLGGSPEVLAVADMASMMQEASVLEGRQAVSACFGCFGGRHRFGF